MTSSFRHQLISEVGGGAAGMRVWPARLAGSWLEPAGNVELVILFGDLIYIHVCRELFARDNFKDRRN